MSLAILVATVPLLVLLDLAGGGTGWGLCQEGVTSCRNPYTAAPELSVVLTISLFGLVAAIRVATKTLRHAERRAAWQSGDRHPKKKSAPPLG